MLHGGYKKEVAGNTSPQPRVLVSSPPLHEMLGLCTLRRPFVGRATALTRFETVSGLEKAMLRSGLVRRIFKVISAAWFFSSSPFSSPQPGAALIRSLSTFFLS
jgi:hypothetical protein